MSYNKLTLLQSRLSIGSSAVCYSSIGDPVSGHSVRHSVWGRLGTLVEESLRMLSECNHVLGVATAMHDLPSITKSSSAD